MQSPTHSDISVGNLPRSIPAFRLIKDELVRVRKLIDEQVADCPDEAWLSRLSGQLSNCGGKMLRPRLLLLSGALFGAVTDKHIRVAAIIEMIHNAALLHDDVIDEGEQRRGGPTVNNLWGNESAVLLGDFLLSKVFEMCADLEPEVTGIIAGATVGTCRGELRQVIQRHNWQLSEAEYIEIITEKTAGLFGSCCLLGGLMSGASEDEVCALADFGLNLGIAFQITDDLLDITGDESKAGKTLGRDVDKNKPTLPVIHLLRAVDDGERNAVIDLFSQAHNTYRHGEKSQCSMRKARYNRDTIKEMLRSYGSLEYAHNRGQEFVAKAIASLAELKDSDAKNALIEAVGFAGRPVI